MGLNRKISVAVRISNLLRTLSGEEIKELQRQLPQPGIPISAFSKTLSTLEIVVRYLKDEEKKSIAEIAHQLKRAKSTIYTTYSVSQRKQKSPLDCSDCSVRIPLSLFAQRKIPVLEALILHLQSQNFSLKEIANLLHRSYSTIKTTLQRSRGAP